MPSWFSLPTHLRCSRWGPWSGTKCFLACIGFIVFFLFSRKAQMGHQQSNKTIFAVSWLPKRKKRERMWNTTVSTLWRFERNLFLWACIGEEEGLSTCLILDISPILFLGGRWRFQHENTWIGRSRNTFLGYMYSREGQYAFVAQRDQLKTFEHLERFFCALLLRGCPLLSHQSIWRWWKRKKKAAHCKMDGWRSKCDVWKMKDEVLRDCSFRWGIRCGRWKKMWGAEKQRKKRMIE